MKKVKGITLIALVITIIVLLILAGISITMVVGNDGIIARASKAKENTDESGVREIVQLEVTGSLTDDGQYSKNLAKTNIEKNLNNPQAIVIDNGDGTLSVNYKDKDLAVDELGNVTIEPAKEPINNDSFVGCYADFENESGERKPDGKPDGIIFADLVAEGNGTQKQWGEKPHVVYIIPKVESGLKKYYIQKEQVTDKKWNETEVKKLISPINGFEGKERFYVMALDELSDISCHWYKSASTSDGINKGMTDYTTYTSKEFGTGRENTKRMIARMDYPNGDGSIPEKYIEHGDAQCKYGKGDADDIWALDDLINMVNKGWFVPSSGEWAAFINELNLTYFNHGLYPHYWASSQSNLRSAMHTYFDFDRIDFNGVEGFARVRLATTF